MNNIIITDSSLRDGNHSVRHTISLDSIERYCKFAEDSNIPIIEVGHGNGLGASSILIGKSNHSDKEMLTVARKHLKNSKLGVHLIPGMATIERDVNQAIDLGVDIFRVASHCTEASITESHISYLKSKNKTVHGVLMMSPLAPAEVLLEQSLLMQSYGAEAIIIMDSTGTYLPSDVEERISLLKAKLNVSVGFHGHNNLGCAIANSLVAAKCGASYIDACIRGFGAGAGNAALEILVPTLRLCGFDAGILFEKLIIQADTVMEYLVPSPVSVTPVNVLTGLYKLFSGFEKPIIKASKLNGIEYSSLIFELGNRKLVAGQEDLIIEIAQQLKRNKT